MVELEELRKGAQARWHPDISYEQLTALEEKVAANAEVPGVPGREWWNDASTSHLPTRDEVMKCVGAVN